MALRVVTASSGHALGSSCISYWTALAGAYTFLVAYAMHVHQFIMSHSCSSVAAAGGLVVGVGFVPLGAQCICL